jgi:hypothetical protein
MHFMSRKAVGTDWKKSTSHTTRHAAGYNDFTKAMFRALCNKLIKKKGQTSEEVAWLDHEAPRPCQQPCKKRLAEEGKGRPAGAKRQRDE